MKQLTEKSLNVLNFLKSVEGDITLNQVAAEMGVEPKSANGTLVSLQRKGLIERVEAGTELVDGKAKVVKYIKVTPAGDSFDQEAAIAEDEAAAAAAAAEKAAAKAAKDAE